MMEPRCKPLPFQRELASAVGWDLTGNVEECVSCVSHRVTKHA